jgi:hypothetical protein
MLDAERIGQEVAGACPNCGATGHKKLPLAGLEALADRFFVWGSLSKARYGAAPLIQFNDRQVTSIEVAPWLAPDVRLFERLLGIGFFHYGPRLWMIGEVEPLKALQSPKRRKAVIKRIIAEYPTITLTSSDAFYRVRVNPTRPADPMQYDSPPAEYLGRNRLDSANCPLLYGSTDLDVCVHECRVSAEDDLYVATLASTKSLRLLDLTALLKEDTTEFESLDMSVHMLFLAGKHSYKLTRDIAQAARVAEFDGLVYPSYFSLLRIGERPFETVYGISHRRIPSLQEYERAKAIPNLALFGRPVDEGIVSVCCINRLVISRVAYDFHFGPAALPG